MEESFSGGEIVFTFDAVVSAIMAEKKLADSGVSVMVMPMPPELGSKCGICLRVEPEQKERSLTLLEGLYKKAYAFSPAGRERFAAL